MNKKLLIYGLGAIGAYFILKRSAATAPGTTLGALGTKLGLGAGGGLLGGAPTGTQLATRFGTATLPARPGLGAVPTTTGQQILQAGSGIGAGLTGLANLFKSFGLGTPSPASQQKAQQTNPTTTSNQTAGAPTSAQLGQAKQQQIIGTPCNFLDISGNCTNDVTQAVFDTSGFPLGPGINPNAPNGFDNSGTPLIQGPTDAQLGIVGLDINGNPTSDQTQAVYPLSGSGFSQFVVGLDANGNPTTDQSQVAFDTSGNPVDEWTLGTQDTTQVLPTDTSSSVVQAGSTGVLPDVSSSGLDTSGSL